jgi:hypothetical protein
LSFTILFPAPLMQARDIIPGGWQHMWTSVLPEFEGDAVRFEYFSCRLIAEVSFALIRCSWMPEKSTICELASARRLFAALLPLLVRLGLTPVASQLLSKVKLACTILAPHQRSGKERQQD